MTMAASQSFMSVAVAALVLLALVSARVPGEDEHTKNENPQIHPEQKFMSINLPILDPLLKTYCIPRSTASDAALMMAIEISCTQGSDCGAIQAGGKCFGGNITHHASYVMNSYYSKNGRHANCCDFNGVGVVTTTNPSFETCVFD